MRWKPPGSSKRFRKRNGGEAFQRWRLPSGLTRVGPDGPEVDVSLDYRSKFRCGIGPAANVPRKYQGLREPFPACGPNSLKFQGFPRWPRPRVLLTPQKTCEIGDAISVLYGGMRPLRHVPREKCLFEVTVRTVQARFLLRPSVALNEIILGVLGRAQRLHEVEICSFAFASNHVLCGAAHKM